MSKQTHAVLLVADISGFTKFMKMHEISLNHAKQIIVRLLKAIMSAAKPPLKVAELEGDAVFFYAPSTEANLKNTAAQVKMQIIDMFNSFKQELYVLQKMEVCECPACMTAGDLRLKQVVHTGEAGLEVIHKNEKLFGVDVIVVHRMLKNSVPADEYVMMTGSAYENFTDFYGIEPKKFRENLEGIGEVDTQVFFGEELSRAQELPRPNLRKPAFWDRVKWKVKLIPPTLLTYIGINTIKGNFKNMPA